MATAIEIKRVMGLQVDLSVEEAQGLFELLFRGVGNNTLADLNLVELLAALRWSGVVHEEVPGHPKFQQSAQMEV